MTENKKPKFDLVATMLKKFGVDPKQLKQFNQAFEIFKLILPKFEVRTLDGEDGEQFAAVLFDYTPENVRRVEATEEMFTDILPPFMAQSYLVLDEEGKERKYSALLFEIPKKESDHADE